MIWLDNAATSFPKPKAVVDAVGRWLTELGVDAARGSSQRHESVRLTVDTCRARLGQLCGTRRNHVVFTGGATEAINLFIKGLVKPGDAVWSTRLEHNAVARPLVALAERGRIDVRFMTPGAIAAALDAGPAPELLVFNHASNVTGVVQDFDAIAARLRAAGTWILADCAQTAGHLDLTRLEADALVVPGHKGLYGPPGIGALCLRRDPGLVALVEGGTGTSFASDHMPAELPGSLESGTPNTPAIFGLLAGIEWVLERGIDELRAHDMALVGRLAAGLAPMTASGRVRCVTGSDPDRSTAVAALVFDDLDPAEVAMILEQHDIFVRAGFHCAPYAHDEIAAPRGTVRVSPGAYNTEADIDRCIDVLADVLET